MTKEGIKDAIRDILKDDTQKRALDFATYLELNEMTLEKVSETLWKADYQDKCICYIYIDGTIQPPGPWTIWFDGDYRSEPGGFTISKHTKELAWKHANICGSCGGSCSPGMSKAIFGKELDNVCNSVLAFNNPDAEVLECVKNLIEMDLL